MSATTRTIQTTPRMGQLVAIFATLLAATLLVAGLAYGQLVAKQAAVAPLAGSAPAANDHGWSTTDSAVAPATFDHGWSSSSATPPIVRISAFDKAHGRVPRAARPEGGAGGSIRGLRAR